MFDFLSKKISTLFNHLSGNSHLTEKNITETIDGVRQALLEADVPYNLVETFIADIKKETLGQKVLSSLKPAEQLMKVIHDRLKAFMGGDDNQKFALKKGDVVMVLGLQGSGKTTSIAKIAQRVIKKEKISHTKILFGSVDFYRPAAIDQLEVLAQKIKVTLYRSPEADPVKAAADIKRQFVTGDYDHLFLDTAGRLHVDNAMLEELRSIDSLVNPQHKMLVLDAMTGQESLNVAQAFSQGVGFDYALLSKMDSDTRGGAAFSFRYALKKPIVFVGSGEKIDDLQQFHPDRMAGAMLGMGDMLTLAEKADEKIKKSEQDAMYRSMASGELTLDDFAKQLSMMGRLGSLSSIMKYIPGMSGMNISQDMVQQGEGELKRFKAVLNSMTQKERFRPAILDGSRKKRIAKGAGVQVSDINLLLSRFEQSKQYVKLLKKSGLFRNMFR